MQFCHTHLPFPILKKNPSGIQTHPFNGTVEIRYPTDKTKQHNLHSKLCKVVSKIAGVHCKKNLVYVVEQMRYWILYKRKYALNWIWIPFSLLYSRDVSLIILRKCFQFSFLISLRIIKTDLQTHCFHGALRPCRGEYLLYVQFKLLSKLFNITDGGMTSFRGNCPRNESEAAESSGTGGAPRHPSGIPPPS